MTMALRDLVRALFGCVTTALGTSDDDVVLLAQPKDDEVSEFNPSVLWKFPSACIKAGSLKTLDPSSVGRELTMKFSGARGDRNKGVLLFRGAGRYWRWRREAASQVHCAPEWSRPLHGAAYREQRSKASGKP